jgi:hypothetical protein
MKRPCSAPAADRAIRKSAALDVTSGAAVATTYPASAQASTGRRPARMVSAVRIGPPMAIPSAYAVTAAPAVLTDTARSAAMRSITPTTSSSALPITNAAANRAARAGPCRGFPAAGAPSLMSLSLEC